MKKIMMAAIALLMASGAMAFDLEPKQGLTWQATFGFNAAQIRNTPMDGKMGVELGIKGEYVLPNAHGTYMNAGLEWTQKGAKVTKSFDIADPIPQIVSATYKINEHYMSIPIHVGFRYNIDKLWGVYGELGPYFAVGIGGKNRFEVNADGTVARENDWTAKTFKKKEGTERAYGGFQRFDCGMGFRVGGEYDNHYSLNLGCDWGFTDILRDNYRDYYFDTHGGEEARYKNFCFTMTFGYRF